MGWLKEIARDHREIERDMTNAKLVWEGSEYPCSIGTAEDRISLVESGGSVIDRTFSVHVRAQSAEGEEPAWDWTNGGGPQEGDEVTVVLRAGDGSWAKVLVSKTGKVGEVTQIHGQLLKIPVTDLTR